MIAIVLGAFIASLGFAFLFNIRGYHLLLAAIGGSIGGATYHIFLGMGTGDLNAIFLASIFFSLYSEICARLCKTPVTTFLICALIPLVPGGGMYRMMSQAIHGNAIQAVNTGLETISIAGALVLGILLISTIMKAICKPRRVQIEQE